MLRPLFAVIALLGVFFVGPFVVLLPLLVRDSYGGSPVRLGVINAMVPLGGILTGLWIVLARRHRPEGQRGVDRQRGRRLERGAARVASRRSRSRRCSCSAGAWARAS